MAPWCRPHGTGKTARVAAVRHKAPRLNRLAARRRDVVGMGRPWLLKRSRPAITPFDVVIAAP